MRAFWLNAIVLHIGPHLHIQTPSQHTILLCLYKLQVDPQFHFCPYKLQDKPALFGCKGHCMLRTPSRVRPANVSADRLAGQTPRSQTRVVCFSLRSLPEFPAHSLAFPARPFSHFLFRTCFALLLISYFLFPISYSTHTLPPTLLWQHSVLFFLLCSALSNLISHTKLRHSPHSYIRK